ncbi:Zn-dependent hydrolase [Candidatus Pacearchaeota archaeon CG10_big_fil_rev_8_21_14_0_10_32_42]|nr:MAG: Zn-dependent hydrolase [Candidatus Pacearchaeota archaeon CG10_big_fil_rev_8_21_14_0_10_32_42]
MKLGEVEIEWLGHSGFLIRNSKVIYVDPFKIKDKLPKADLILITHGHYDHCSFEDIGKIVQDGTRILMTADAQSKIARFQVPIRMEVVAPGQEFDIGMVKISTIPAYNIDKTFHTKEEGLVGYVIKIDDIIIYHAGDTDVIPEMQKLTGHNQPDKKFVALLPVGGRFTMSAEEAAEAAKIIKPAVAIPMHWGTIIGSLSDAEEFKELCEHEGIKVEILEKI